MVRVGVGEWGMRGIGFSIEGVWFAHGKNTLISDTACLNTSLKTALVRTL